MGCNCDNVDIGTFKAEVPVKLKDGSTIQVDSCIAAEIKRLNELGVKTEWCCCGHNKTDGIIIVHESSVRFMEQVGYEHYVGKKVRTAISNKVCFYPLTTTITVPITVQKRSKKMGVDVEIYFETKDREDPQLEWDLPDEYIISPAEEWAIEEYAPTATHQAEMKGNDRYYSDGYERGFWPGICSILMLLLSSRNVVKVWYGGDTGGTLSECDTDEVLRLSEHFMKHGNRPYRGK